MKCTKCYEAEAAVSWWDKVKSFFAFRLFGEFVSDEKASSFTKGFGDGYKSGREHERNRI
jgi:hypothetical protein